MKGSSRAEKLLACLATHPDLDPDALRALIKATRSRPYLWDPARPVQKLW